MSFECPGAKTFRNPQPEFIKCPFCGNEVEIWTDEIKMNCSKCKRTVTRDQDMGCLDWCKYAKECVGEDAYDNYIRNRHVVIKSKLFEELEGYFGEDKKRIAHAKKVTGWVERLLQAEEGDWRIVMPAGVLHDVGIKQAELKYNSSAGHYQEKEGPPIARDILLKLGLQKEDIGQICEIIAHHHSPGKINTQNFKILYDADWLVNLKDIKDIKSKDGLRKFIDKTFLTETGKKLAKEEYLKS